jgi:methionyl-tRNA formyltransferase
MRLVFMGTPAFARVALQALLDAGHDVAAVYTQPPRPAGRGYGERRSAVHDLAAHHGLATRTPASLKSAAEHEAFAALRPEAAIVVAYGLLLPEAILNAPAHGCFNIHASLLPRWRGAAPIQRAIMAGDRETGVSIMKMDRGLDTGPVCRTERILIGPETTFGSLHDDLARLGAELIVNMLENFPPACRPQAEAGVTYAQKIEKSETRIDFSRDMESVRNHIHGLSPSPGAWCMISGARIRVLQCTLAEGAGPAGTVLDEALTIACGRGAIRFLKVQREGKGAVDAPAFLRGFPVRRGERIA